MKAVGVGSAGAPRGDSSRLFHHALLLATLATCLSGCFTGVVWFGKTPDRTRDVAVLQDMTGQYVRVDGVRHKAYPAIGVESLAWSPDGARLAYPARVQAGWALVTDGAEGPVMDGIGEVVWSADGKHIAYAAERKGRWLVVRDGEEAPSLESLRARSLRFSQDGEHLAYVGDEDRKVVAVVDGVKSTPYDAIGHLIFGAAGSVAFAGRRGGTSVVVRDGRESTAYEDIADLAFSPSGKRLAWTARKLGAWWVVEDLSESGPFERVSSLVWAPRGEKLAFAVGGTAGERVVRDGRDGALYEGVLPGSLTFDAAGAHIVYAARRGHAWRVVTDDVEGPPYEDLEAPQFLGDTTATAFVARRGEATFLVLDGHQGPVEADASSLVLSPDGKRFMYAARAGLKVRVVEGVILGGPCGEGRCAPFVKRKSQYDTVVAGTLVFSDSGAHSGYLAGQQIGHRLFLVRDGERAGDLDLAELMAGVVVSPDLAGALTGDSKALGQWVRAEVNLAERRGGNARVGVGGGGGAKPGDRAGAKGVVPGRGSEDRGGSGAKVP